MAEDDDGGAGLNSAIVAELEPGSYVILVRGFQRAARGAFTLSVREGRALPPGAGAPAGPPVPRRTLSGTVSASTGRSDVPVSAPCTVTVEPVARGFNCRVRVTCAGQLIYGAGQAGYNNCIVTGAPPQQSISANDTGSTAEDGDPRLSLDTAAATATVSDAPSRGPWTVSVTLTR